MAKQPDWNTDPGGNPIEDIQKLVAELEDAQNNHTFPTGIGPTAPPVPGHYLEVDLLKARGPVGFSLEQLKHVAREANEELRLQQPEYASDVLECSVRPERGEAEVLCSNINSIAFIRGGIALLAPASWHVSVRPFPTDRESVERMGAALEELERAVR